MRIIKIGLPAKHKLEIKLVKSRARLGEKPLIHELKGVFYIRKGSKVSRFFRHIFEHKNIRKALGTNLAFMMLAANLTPSSSNAVDLEIEPDLSTASAPLVLTTNDTVYFPVSEVKITQGYRFYHPAIDLDGITGDTITPIMKGVVEKIEYSYVGYGNSVVVAHDQGYSSLYAHLSKINVKKGEPVTTSTKIGEMGATGRAFGDHLHLEVYQNGSPINPLSVLPK